MKQRRKFRQLMTVCVWGVKGRPRHVAETLEDLEEAGDVPLQGAAS